MFLQGKQRLHNPEEKILRPEVPPTQHLSYIEQVQGVQAEVIRREKKVLKRE